MSASSAAIDALRKRNPDALRLAQVVSFAVIVDRALLRTARLELVRGADAGAEADLWFSNLVKSRTADGIVLDSEAAEELRSGMTTEEVEAAWRVTSREHEPWLAPSLKFEEEIAYLSVSAEPGARDQITRRVQSVVRAMLRHDRPGLAQWASRALSMFPSAVRELPETKMLDAGTRIRLGQGVSTGETLPEWMPLVVPSMGRTAVQVEFHERELRLTAGAEEGQVVRVPGTNPVVVELSWNAGGAPSTRQVVLRQHEQVRVPVGSDSVRIRTITGEEFDISESAHATATLAAEVIDFTEEIARYPTPVNRIEIASIMTLSGLVVMYGDPGVGKTTILCEIIRRLDPEPVFVHFFDPGDYERGRFYRAMRSIAAQIAMRYHLEESVVDLPTGDVLARLALSPRCPERLFIALDDIDRALDEYRSPMPEPIEMMFGTVPDFVTVFATAREGGSQAIMPNDEALAKARKFRAIKLNGPAGLTALGAAKWWLPATLFEDVADRPEVLRRGDEVRGVSSLERDFGNAPYAHRGLLERLEQHRYLEPVRRYYALHAPAHIEAAANKKAATNFLLTPAFMKEVVRLHDTALLKAHISQAYGLSSVLKTLEREDDAIAADPENIVPVLRTYVPDILEPAFTALEVVERPERNEGLGRRRHEGAVGGVIDGPFTWGSDGRLINWTDPETPKTVENACEITAAAAVKGGSIVFGDAAGFIHGWSGAFGVFAAHAGPIAGITAAVRSPLFASWGTDGLIRLWIVGEVIEPAGELGFHDDDITGCKFVGDGRLLVSSSRDGTIRTWNVAERRAIQTIRKDSPVVGFVTCSDGRWFAAVDEAGNLTIDAIEPATVRSVTPHVLRTNHHGGVHGIAISSDDGYLATWGGESDGTIIWRVLSSPLPPERSDFIETPRGRRIATCTFLDYRSILVSWSGGGMVISELGKDLGTTPLDTEGAEIWCVADRPQTFFTGDDRGRLVEWLKPDGRRDRDYSLAPQQIRALVAVDDVVLLVKENGQVRLDGSLIDTVPSPRLLARSDYAVVWSENSAQLLRVDLRRRNTEEISIEYYAPLTIALSDFGVIALAYGGSLHVIDREGRSSILMETLTDAVTALAFTLSDAELLAGTASGEVMKVDIGSRAARTISREGGLRVMWIEFDDRTDRYATITADGVLRVFSDKRPGPLGMMDAQIDPALGCRFGPNGEVIAVTRRSALALWNSQGTITTEVHSAAFTGFDIDDDDVIYTCSEDRTVRMWSIPELQQLGVAYGYDAFRAISAEGNDIVAGDDAGEIWRFRRNPVLSRWRIDFDEEGAELATMLKASLARVGIPTTTEGDSEDIISIVSRMPSTPNMGVTVFIGDELIPPPYSVDFRYWRDPYVYEARLRELIPRLTRRPPP